MNSNRHRQLVAILIGAAALGCSEGGVSRRPAWSPGSEMPGGPAAPTIIDLTDAPVTQEGFCGTIGSGGIRAIVPLGGDGAFAVAYGSGRIVLQDIGRPTAHRTLNAHESPITQVKVSADGQFLLSASEAGEVKVWRVKEGQLIRVVRERGSAPGTVALSVDGTRIALLNGDGVSVEQAIEGAVLWRAMPRFSGGVLAFSADGQTLVYGGDTVVFANARDGQELRQVFTMQFGVRAVSPDLTRFVGMRSRTREVAMLDSATGAPIWSTVIPSGDYLAVTDGTFSADLRHVAVTTKESGLLLLNAADGALVRQWPVTDGTASAVTFSSTSSRLAIGLFQGGFRAWDLPSGELLVKESAVPGHQEPATQVAFSADGTLVGTMASGRAGGDKSLKVWRTGDAALLYSAALNPTDGSGRAFAISPDSSTIALSAGYIAGQLHLLAARDGSLRGTVENADATDLTYSPDGSLLVGRSHCIGCVPSALRVWRVADGQEQPGFGESPRQSGDGVIFSPDGALLAATSDGNSSWLPDGFAGPRTREGPDSVAVWRVSDRALLWSRPSAVGEFSRAAFSADGKLVAVSTIGDLTPSSTTGAINVHDSRDGTMVRELSLPGVRAVAFTPTGELVAAGDSGLRMWRLTDGQPIAQARGSFTALAISPDGQKLVAAARDGSLNLLCGIERALR